MIDCLLDRLKPSGMEETAPPDVDVKAKKALNDAKAYKTLKKFLKKDREKPAADQVGAIALIHSEYSFQRCAFTYLCRHAHTHAHIMYAIPTLYSSGRTLRTKSQLSPPLL